MKKQINHLLPPLLAFLFLILGIIACGPSDILIDQPLIGKYKVLAIDTINQTAIVETTAKPEISAGVIGRMVFSYGWNADFIIVKQHPAKTPPPFIVDMNITNWFIIEVASGKVHGPLTEEAYLDLRKELQVPDSVTFTESITPEAQP